MIEHLDVLEEMKLPLPTPNPDPAVTIRNEKQLAREA